MNSKQQRAQPLSLFLTTRISKISGRLSIYLLLPRIITERDPIHFIMFFLSQFGLQHFLQPS